MKKTNIISLLMLLSVFLSALHAETTSAEEQKTKINTGIKVYWSFGQIVNTSFLRDYDHEDEDWLDGKAFGYIGTSLIARARIREKLQIYTEFLAAVNYGPDEGNRDVPMKRTQFATMRYTYARLALRQTLSDARSFLTIGYFPFNYAPETQDIGAYLFKTGTYPGFIISGSGEWRLTGFHLQTKIPEMLQHNLFFTAEMDYPPIYDMSLTYLAKLEKEHFNASAGVMLDRVIQARARKTSPKEGSGPTKLATSAYYDTRGNAVLDENGDTTWYTKAGVKLMLRGCFDFKKFISSARLGDNDLKLYAEAALLGVKSYPGYYDKISERIPAMLGLNLPTFKVLDLLAVEAEYYKSPWRNNPNNTDLAPTPYNSFEFNTETQTFRMLSPDLGAGEKGKDDNIKWAVTAKKSISRFMIEARVASDHFRYVSADGSVPSGDERLHGPDEWYWQLILTAGL